MREVQFYLTFLFRSFHFEVNGAHILSAEVEERAPQETVKTYSHSKTITKNTNWFFSESISFLAFSSLEK